MRRAIGCVRGMPWHLWVGGRLLFSGDERSIKCIQRNLDCRNRPGPRFHEEPGKCFPLYLEDLAHIAGRTVQIGEPVVLRYRRLTLERTVVGQWLDEWARSDAPHAPEAA